MKTIATRALLAGYGFVEKPPVATRHQILRYDLSGGGSARSPLRWLLAVSLFKGISHLFREIAGFDMRIVFADDFLGVIESSGGGRMA